MIAHQFKGGTGTASRLTSTGHTLGVLVQANYGGRTRFTVAGVPVGREIPDLLPNWEALSRGSIIVVVATDAPLVPQQLQRLAERVPLAIGRLGGVGGNSSGDIFIAFSTGNPGAWNESSSVSLDMLPNASMNSLFEATIEATEEAILNAMVAAETMTGRDSLTAHAMPHDRLQEALRKYGRWVDPASLPRAASVTPEEMESLAGAYRDDGILGEVRIYVDNEKLFLAVGSRPFWVVTLTDGRMLVLGTSGLELERMSGQGDGSKRLRLVRDGAVVTELRQVEDE